MTAGNSFYYSNDAREILMTTSFLALLSLAKSWFHNEVKNNLSCFFNAQNRNVTECQLKSNACVFCVQYENLATNGDAVLK
jgi:hypothetical protein